MKSKVIRVLAVMALSVVLAGSSFYYSLDSKRNAVRASSEAMEIADNTAEEADEEKEDIKENPDTEIEDIQDTEEPEWPKIVYTDFKVESAFPSEDTFCVYNGKEFLFLTQEGKNLTGDTYDMAYPFHEGLACVCREGKYGYIDPEGETAIPFTFDDAGPFMEDLAYFCKDGKYGFMDQTEKPKFYLDCDSVSEFVEGLAYFCVDGRYGYIDSSGNTVIEPIYDDAGYFDDGTAEVVKDSKRGIIDKTGHEIVPVEYVKIRRVQSCFLASRGKTYEVYDGEGNFLSGQEFSSWKANGEICNEERGISGLLCQGEVCVFDKLYDIREVIPERRLVIASLEDTLGVIDFEGEIKIPFSYTGITYNRAGNVFVVQNMDGACGLLDAGDFNTWHVLWDNDYDYIRSPETEQAMFEVKKEDKYGIMDPDGEMILTLDDYERLEILENGAYWTEKNDEYRRLYKDGKIVRQGHFGLSCEGDYYAVYSADPDTEEITYIDDSGKEIVSMKDYHSDSISYFYYPGIQFMHHLEGSTEDGFYAIVQTRDAEEEKLPDCLFSNHITPRVSMFWDFLQNGIFEAEDEGGIHSYNCADWRGYHTVYKIYDFSHTGKPVLYVYASPYNPMGTCSGFFVCEGNEMKILCSAYNTGARDPLGYDVGFYYDREEEKILYTEYGGLSYGRPEFSNGFDHTKIYEYDGEVILKYSDARIFRPEEETECFIGGERVTIEEYGEMMEHFHERYIFLGHNIWNK